MLMSRNEHGPGAAAAIDVYTAPETHMQQPFGPSSDVVSMGCVYIEMLAIAAGIPFADLCRFLEEERQAQHI